MAYKDPTLIEQFAEFHFAPGSFATANVLVTAEKVMPALGGETEFAVGIGVNGEALPRVRCWSPDKKRLVQIGEERLIVNQVAPYPGWEAFVAHARAALDCSGYPGVAVASVSFQAIDRFEVQASGFSLGRYLVCDGERIPRWYASVSEPCDITHGHGLVRSDGFNRQLKIQVRAQDEKRAIRVEWVFHEATSGNPLEKLESLHDQSTAAFEALVTDVTRNEVMHGRI